jgi:cell division protein FtsI/penicillin-binding protein 2
LPIANLGLTEDSTYSEQRNYAVWERTEPGSTFKLASLLVALEDGVVDTADVVDTENGIYTIYGKKIKDSNVKYGRGGLWQNQCGRGISEVIEYRNCQINLRSLHKRSKRFCRPTLPNWVAQTNRHYHQRGK